MAIIFDKNNKYIVSLNVSDEKGTIKTPCEKVKINKLGIIGDAHAGLWHRQISMLAEEDVENFSDFNADGRKFKSGEFAENITTRGIDYKKVCVLDRFQIGEVELEVTQIGKKCHGDGCAIYVEVGKCVMPKSGIFTRVIKEGEIKTGDKIEYYPKPLNIHILTLSDRASAGEYQDLSGPTIKNLLEEYFANKRWHVNFSNEIISDNSKLLFEKLNNSNQNSIDLLFTTGGTGIGPRDITPDVVSEYCDKLVPGIMEFIRVKFGGNIPNALCSRGVVGIKENMIIYTLPGSVKAVTEYTEEIVKTLEHMILMLHGLGH